MTTVRLPIEYEQKLIALAEQKNKTKSELIKEALDIFFHKTEAEKNSYELGERYFGRHGSGDGFLSVRYKQRVKEKIHAAHRTH